MFATLLMTLAPVSLPEDGWIAFEQPAVTSLRQMGCGDDGKASLHDDVSHWGDRQADGNATHDRFTIYVSFADGQPQDLRAFTPDCDVDGAGQARRVQMNTDEAVEKLHGWIDGSEGKSLNSRMMAALAHIDDDDVDALLDDFASDLERERLNRDALFWLAQRRGEAGREIVRQHLDARWPLDHRKQAVMMLALSKHPEALESVRQVARSAGEADMRAQAVTALGITEAPGALSELHGIFLVDESRKVREQAIFGIAQLEGESAARLLLDIARNPDHGEHRRTALFWLANMEGGAGERAFDELLDEKL